MIFEETPDRKAAARISAGDRDRLRIRRFKCNVHRTIADGARPMPQPARNSHHLSGLEFQCTTLEFDFETPFDYEKCLIGIGMEVPVVGLRHHANPHDMIIDVRDRMIVVAGCG